MSQQDANSVLACCRRFGHQEPSLWVQALWSCVRDTRNPPANLLSEVCSSKTYNKIICYNNIFQFQILNVVAKERLLSPQLVIEAVGTAQSNISLGHIRSYIVNELKKETEIIVNETELTNKYSKDTAKLKENLETLKSGSTVFQGSRCAACHHQLELPSIHFMCQHSYHQYCFQSFSEHENECPACVPENLKLIELLKAREYNKDLHETFHSQLEKASDGFSLAAEYYGRGVFNKVTVITDIPVEKPITKTETIIKEKPRESKPPSNYGLGAEARIRQMENARTASAIIPTPEGRIRLQENKYSSSLEANITKPICRSAESSLISSSVEKNPFENDYDESKNPFATEEFEQPSTFDDYDKNLNPFSS